LLKKLFAVVLVATFIAACGPATEEQTPDQEEAPMNENMEQNGNNGDITPGETDENLNREQIEDDMDDMLPDDNNNN